MRGSNFSAAFSPVRAISSARSASTIPLSGSRQRKLGQRFRMQRSVGQSRPRIGGRKPRQLDRVRDEIPERIALEFRG